MKRAIWIVVIVSLYLPCAHAKVLETIDATVNGELILSGEIDMQILQEARSRNLFQTDGTRLTLPDDTYQQLRGQIVQRTVDQLLIIQFVRSRLEESELERIRQIIQRRTERDMMAYDTPEKLAQEERDTGMTWEEIRQAVYELNYNQYIRNVITYQLANLQPKIPSDAEIAQFQKDHPEIQPTGKIEIQDIQLNIPPNASPEQEQEVLQKAREVVVRARGGDLFEYLVEQYSQNETLRANEGRIPAFEKGGLSPEFDILFDKQVGEIPDPIRTANAYHVVRLLSKDTWQERVMAQKKRELLEKWLDDLREKAKIEVRDRKSFTPILPGKQLQTR